MNNTNDKKCPNCGAELKFSVVVDFQIGAKSSNLIKQLELPKTEEGVLPLSLFVCHECGSVQFFAPKEIQQSLLNLAAQRQGAIGTEKENE